MCNQYIYIYSVCIYLYIYYIHICAIFKYPQSHTERILRGRELMVAVPSERLQGWVEAINGHVSQEPIVPSGP